MAQRGRPKGLPLRRIKRRVVVRRFGRRPAVICYVPYSGRPSPPNPTLHCQHDGIALYDGTIVITNPIVIEALKAWCKSPPGTDDNEMQVDYQC